MSTKTQTAMSRLLPVALMLLGLFPPPHFHLDGDTFWYHLALVSYFGFPLFGLVLFLIPPFPKKIKHLGVDLIYGSAIASFVVGAIFFLVIGFYLMFVGMFMMAVAFPVACIAESLDHCI